MLAALPSAGPATVQARKTFVSLVTPRRTFAVVQAATKSRVNLGLRLDHQSPGGRLLPARDLGAATVRIPLTRPEDVDADVLGWLRRAYRENAAPPSRRRPPRRPAPVLGQLTVVIEGFDLPGLTCAPEPGGQVHENIHVALAGPRKTGTHSQDRPVALRFYQRRGFRPAAVHLRAVDDSRSRLKPEIPATGAYRIPMRDEIELEKRP